MVGSSCVNPKRKKAKQSFAEMQGTPTVRPWLHPWTHRQHGVVKGQMEMAWAKLESRMGALRAQSLSEHFRVHRALKPKGTKGSRA